MKPAVILICAGMLLSGCASANQTWCGEFETVFNQAESVATADSDPADVVAAFTERQATFEAMPLPDDRILAEAFAQTVISGAAFTGGGTTADADSFYTSAILVETRCAQLGESVYLGGDG